MTTRWHVYQNRGTGRWIAERETRDLGFSFDPGCHQQAVEKAHRSASTDRVRQAVDRRQESARKRARVWTRLWAMLILAVIAVCIAGVMFDL